MKGYKTIPTYPDYAISRGGRVIRRKDGKVMKQSINSSGYYQISVGGTPLKVHRLMAETYLTNDPKSMRHKPVHHINGDRLDNRITNLILCENVEQHTYEHFIVREYFRQHIAHTKKFRQFRDMMLVRYEGNVEVD